MATKPTGRLWRILGLLTLTLAGAGSALARPAMPADNSSLQAVDCAATSWMVANEADLNAAIACFNAKTAAGSYTISFGRDIALSASSIRIVAKIGGASLAINGNSYKLDGQKTSGVRPINVGLNTTASIDRLYITGGAQSGAAEHGGGLNNLGTLTLTNSTIAANVAGGRGGGIENAGTLTIANSTISGNSASDEGGGVDNLGTLTIHNSTISSNRAANGPGIETSGNATLDSVTIASNTASGPISAGFALGTGTANIRNSIIVGGCIVATGTLTDGGHNLVQTSGNCPFSDGVNGTITEVDARLGTLQDNGGPTKTHALGLSSPARDAGSTSLTTDQRGVTRPSGAATDIGALEDICGSATSWTVASEGNLNAAIACFNAATTAGSYTISFGGDIALSASSTGIDNFTPGTSLTINGNGYRLDGQNISGVRPITIGLRGRVSIDRLYITGGATSQSFPYGGGILNNGTLTLTNSTVAGNVAGIGGGIHNDGRMTLDNSTISGNTTGGVISSGGGINSSGSLTISNSTISGNSSFAHPGIAGGDTTLDSVTITGNIAASGPNPESLYFQNGTASVRNSIIVGGCGVVDGTLSDGGHNLVQTAGSCAFSNGVNGTIVGADPKLGPLANNGGPSFTHALLPGSPAIDAGDTTLTTDQRGATRPDGSTDDIGAYELAHGTVVIRVKATPAGADTFSFIGSGSLGNHTIKAGDKQSVFGLTSGSYTLTEATLAGYNLTGLTCQDSASGGTASTVDVATRSATINLDEGETVICTFTNAMQPLPPINPGDPVPGSISVEAITQPDSSDSFSFDGGSLGSFTLDAGQTRDFANLAAGSYTIGVTDAAASGYQISSIICTDSTGATVTGNLEAGNVTLTLAAGQQYHCTFVKTKQAELILLVLTDGPDGSFAFTSTLPGGNFTLATSGSVAVKDFPNLPAGSYNLSQAVQQGWYLAGAACSDGSPLDAISITTGEQVLCLVANGNANLYLPLIVR